MRTARKTHKILAGVLAFALALILGAGVPAVPAYAASGNVYTCSITPCYRHPVTGAIEDSGGESSYATGQGMVEGCIYTTGIMEVTDSGEYYLTIRMSLIDYTSNQSFWVQNVGDSGWSSPAMGVTGNGSDSNGTTSDVCIQVPSENCVVRVSMYVSPMGRDVVFYLYPSNYSSGNNTDMNATMVTAASGRDAAQASERSGGTASGSSQTSGSAGSGASSGSGSLSSSGSLSAGNSSLKSSTEDAENAAENDGEAPALSSSITAPADSDTTAGTEDTTLNDAQGLSLSTAENTGEEAEGTSAGLSSGGHIFATAAAVVVAGLILMAAAALIVYYFHKNWRRWGGGDDDDDYEYEDENEE